MGTELDSVTLIRGGHLFDLDRGLERADIRITDGMISEVGPNIDGAGATVLDVTGDVVIPGLVNAHLHSNQTIESALCDTLPLDAYLVLASYGGAGARLSPRDLYVSAMVGAIEMVKTGCTSTLDCARADLEWIGDGLDSIAQAYVDIGFRAHIAAQFSDLDFFSSIPIDLAPGGDDLRKPPRAAPDVVLADVEAFVGRWKGRYPTLQPLLGPSSLPRCSTELFEAAVDLSRRIDTRLQTHLLSAKSQVLLGQERYGGSTVAFLERIGCLGPWASFAHSIWLDNPEIEALARTGSVVVHNPVSNMKLGAGVAPIPAMRAAGVTVALGSDGASSNDSQNLFETIKASALLSRVTTPHDQWVTGRSALEMCWHGGADALGVPVGRIEPGARADLAVLEGDATLRGPVDQIVNRLAFAELGAAVRTVMVDGRVLMLDRRFTTIDEDAIRAEADDLRTRIWDSLPGRLARFEDMAPSLAEMERIVAELQLGVVRSCEL